MHLLDPAIYSLILLRQVFTDPTEAMYQILTQHNSSSTLPPKTAPNQPYSKTTNLQLYDLNVNQYNSCINHRSTG